MISLAFMPVTNHQCYILMLSIRSVLSEGIHGLCFQYWHPNTEKKSVWPLNPLPDTEIISYLISIGHQKPPLEWQVRESVHLGMPCKACKTEAASLAYQLHQDPSALISINSNDKCGQRWQRLINSQRGEITGIRHQILYCQRTEQVLKHKSKTLLSLFFLIPYFFHNTSVWFSKNETEGKEERDSQSLYSIYPKWNHESWHVCCSVHCVLLRCHIADQCCVLTEQCSDCLWQLHRSITVLPRPSVCVYLQHAWSPLDSQRKDKGTPLCLQCWVHIQHKHLCINS